MEFSRNCTVWCFLLYVFLCCVSSQLVLFNQQNQENENNDMNTLLEIDELEQRPESDEMTEPRLQRLHPHPQKDSPNAGYKTPEEIYVPSTRPKSNSKLSASFSNVSSSLSSKSSSYQKAGPLSFSSSSLSLSSSPMKEDSSIVSSLPSSELSSQHQKEERDKDFNNRLDALALEELQLLSELVENDGVGLDDVTGLKRVKRDVDSFAVASGETIRIFRIKFINVVPTPAQLNAGSSQNRVLRLAIADALDVFLQAIFSGLTVQVAVTEILAGSIIAKGEIRHFSVDITQVEMATALNSIVTTGELKVGGSVYTVQQALLTNENNATQTLGAICYLCDSHQVCVLEADTNKYICKTNALHYFPFGSNAGDRTISKGWENARGYIRIRTGIPYNSEIVQRIYISVNGIISFGSRYTSFNPRTLPIGNRKLLAPYWTDLDIENIDPLGNVFYQLYSLDDNDASEAAVFAQANQAVVNYTAGVSSYSASHVIIATWEGVQPYPALASGTVRVSFQVAIISDGESTYVMYIYPMNGLNMVPGSGRNIVIGWDNNNFDVLDNYFIFDDIAGNTNSDGLWLFRIGQARNTRALCINWARRNRNIRFQISGMNAFIPACPCSEFTAFFSNFWIRSTSGGCYDSVPIFFHYGRRCCYTGGSLRTIVPNTGNFMLFNPMAVSSLLHRFWDFTPKQWCCNDHPDLCATYYQYRPVRNQNCRRLFFRRWAFLFGDPHINTIDGFGYTFNGIGEYTLMQIDAVREIQVLDENNAIQIINTTVNFVMQARTCQAKNKDGKYTDATVFCGIGARDTNGTGFFVGLPEADSAYLEVYINGKDHSARFINDTGYSVVDNEVTLTRSNDTINIFTKDKIGINLDLTGNLIDFSLEVDEAYEGKVKGLLGNFNGNKDDDLIFPNGTVLSNTSSDEEKFAFGQAWSITQDTSVLQYKTGKSHASYTNASFVPIFLDQVNDTVRAEAETVCDGIKNQACIFDFIATKDETVATATKDQEANFDQQQTQLENRAPVIENHVNESLFTVVNQTSSFSLSASDEDAADTVRFVVLESPGSDQFNYTTSGTTFSASVKPNSSNPILISIAAEDSQGLQSEAQVITIVNCNCLNGGSCNYLETPEEINFYYSVAQCNCTQAYTGDQCESLVDSCADSPCPDGTNCTNNNPAVIESTGIFHNCSSCPSGQQLTLNDTKCEDINECLASPCDAVGSCTNLFGSFRCTCPDGYRASNDGSHKCTDINECTENSHECVQLCTNTDGGYNCSCEPGFTVSGLLDRNCTQDAAADPCSGLSKKCSYGCKTERGNPVCFCKSGYKLAADTLTCENIDECEEKLCSQTCTDSEGSYTCSCLPGFTLDKDAHGCNMCGANKYGPDCSKTCQCRGRALGCDAVKGCICNAQWSGDFCNDDVDECTNDPNICPEQQECHNIDGGFECRCATGFTDTSNNGTCQDINECEDSTINNCTQVCENSPGSYKCTCNPGYQYNSNTNTCEDIDECADKTSGCTHKCLNVAGSFNCDCEQGYALRADRKTCAEVEKVCADSGLNCGFACTIINSEFTCICSPGYQLGSDNEACLDINECQGTNLCSDTCDNNEGSYTCSCPDGKELNSDKRTCADCDDYHWGPNCANQCECSPLGTNTCNKQSGCVCKQGWRGDKCEIDIDECNGQAHSCNDGSVCVNTAGSYVCTCNTGYTLNSTTRLCEDVNECSSNPCDQTCVNTVGSYNCLCGNGFYVNGDECIDINECENANNHQCQQICRNTQGSYACECEQGFELDITDPNRNKCTLEPTSTCLNDSCVNSDCVRRNGSDECICRSGYSRQTSTYCQNIDECTVNSESPCKGTGATCVDDDGGFNCSCVTPGFKLADSGVNCNECDDGLFGTNCAETCKCTTASTSFCNKTDGTCVCASGWEGEDCSQDINECDNSTLCGSNSVCQNLDGSHACYCNDGFVFSEGSCNPCSSTSFGRDCAQTCTCQFSNTQDCVDTSGDCLCKTGWEGDDCSNNTNECLNTTICPNPIETCEDLQGSYECACIGGYSKIDSVCTNINECLLSLSDCIYPRVCKDTIGSFECVCDDGYLTINNTCAVNFNSYLFNMSMTITGVTVDDKLKEDIANAIYNYSLSQIDQKLLKVVVSEITGTGPYKVKTEIQINKDFTDTPDEDAAKLLKAIASQSSFMVNGKTADLNNIEVNNSPFRADATLCDIFVALTGDCGSGKECREVSGNPTCVDEEDNLDLIIGLSVGIPLFVILCVLVAVGIYFYARDKKRDSAQSTPSAERDAAFHSVFASKMAPKGSWGSPQRFGMYSPDTYSEAGTSDSSMDGQLMKGRQKVRSDFQDSPWYQNQGNTPRDMPAAESQGESGAPTSNFSWEYMFKLLEPHKGFGIQRPNITHNPNPAYQS